MPRIAVFQNRERVFCVSIRKDIDNGSFKYNEPFDNGVRLKELLEDEVDEKYYIADEKVEKLISQLKAKNQEISYCVAAKNLDYKENVLYICRRTAPL